MGLLRNAFEKRDSTLANPKGLLELFGRGAKTTAGVSVTPEKSLQLTAVFACVRILAESIGTLPLITYQRTGEGSKKRATNHYLYSILKHLPNPEMTAIELKEILTSHKALRGNAYAEIQWNNAGEVQALWPLRPDKMDIVRYNGELIYKYTLPGGGTVGLPRRNVLHLKCFGYDGIKGYSPIALAREAVGLGLATEEFGARFFGNGARPGLILEHPNHLSEKAQKRLKKSFQMRHQGLENAHRIAIFEEGMTAKEVGIPPEEAQFLQTRKFQLAEIARIFRIPPHMIADLDRATFNNIEHLSLEFVMFTLLPWLTRWEQAIYRDLLIPAHRKTYFSEFLLDNLLRGDIKTRYEAYSIGRQNGWLNADEIRAMENLNPIGGKAGTTYLMPLNMVASGSNPNSNMRAELLRSLQMPIPSLNSPTVLEKRAATVKSRHKISKTYYRLILNVTKHMVDDEVRDIRKAARKQMGNRNANDFIVWLESYYRKHPDHFYSVLWPIVRAYAEQIGLSVEAELDLDLPDIDDETTREFLDTYVQKLAASEAINGLKQLKTVIKDALNKNADPLPAVELKLDQWAESKAERIARHQRTKAANAFARQFYKASGMVQHLRWVTDGENCPYCDNLDGAIVGINDSFLNKGDFEPEGAERPLKVWHNVNYPPLHKNCDCSIVAEL